jgi:S-adenosyl methyltransferase
VAYLAAECGIRQFLDIGTGLPAPDATHEVAQAVAPDCAVAYADNDPLVLVYARALLTARPPGRCGYVHADLRDPAALLAQASATLDFTQPVAVLLLAILHFLPAADDPAGIVGALARALAAGSYLVLSHLTADFAPDQVGAAVAAYNAVVPAGVTAAQPRRGHRLVRRPATGPAGRGPGHPMAPPPPPVPHHRAPTCTPGSPAPHRTPAPVPPASPSSSDSP